MQALKPRGSTLSRENTIQNRDGSHDRREKINVVSAPFFTVTLDEVCRDDHVHRKRSKPDFVFDVDDAQFLISLQYHFLMTGGQHVVRECSCCVTMTCAFARYNVGKNGFVNPSSRARVVISVVLAREQKVCGERRHAARTRLMMWALIALGTYVVSAPVSERFRLRSLCAFESEASWLNKKNNCHQCWSDSLCDG